jgi:hypothetical protein
MDVRADAEEPVEEAPLHRAPVIGEEKIGSHPAQHAGEGHKRGEWTPLVERQDGELGSRRFRQLRARGGDAVEREHAVPIAWSEAVHHLAHANRNAARAEAREDVQEIGGLARGHETTFSAAVFRISGKCIVVG